MWYVITRMNLGIYDSLKINADQWFADRLNRYRTVTLPSIPADKTPLLLIDKKTPRSHRQQLAELKVELAEFDLEGTSILHSAEQLESYLPQYFKSKALGCKTLVVTSIDNDDAFLDGYFDDIDTSKPGAHFHTRQVYRYEDEDVVGDRCFSQTCVSDTADPFILLSRRGLGRVEKSKRFRIDKPGIIHVMHPSNVFNYPKQMVRRMPSKKNICVHCENYRAASCKAKGFCLLLTREADLAEYWKNKECPLGKWSNTMNKTTEVKIFDQPKNHPARWKKIFMRADGSLVDLIDLYHGKSVFLCCGGPSFGKIDHSIFNRPGIITMAVNNTAHRFRPDLWTAQDPQYRFMPSIWEDPKIMKFTLWDYRRKPYWNKKEDRFADRTLEQCPNLFYHKRKSDLNAATWLDENQIVWGTPKKLEDGSQGARSVFLAALHILYFLGFHKVYLVGADFKMDADNKYWFDEQRGPAAIRNNARVYEHTNEHCINLRPHLEKAGFNVFNTNPDSGLKAFDFYDLDKAISENTVSLAESTEGMYVKR